jgi:hypothetical protein
MELSIGIEWYSFECGDQGIERNFCAFTCGFRSFEWLRTESARNKIFPVTAGWQTGIVFPTAVNFSFCGEPGCDGSHRVTCCVVVTENPKPRRCDLADMGRSVLRPYMGEARAAIEARRSGRAE